ncbi:MAG: hypothetical protein KDA45_13965, partial [Planctomycetales bacterium]|nr:hypothetical protein [Planctomycetales bacterium]
MSVCGVGGCQALAEEVHSAQLRFFESKIRPALIEHCVECHAADSESSGGLLLDSAPGWQAGGDSGAAIIPGQPEQSRLLRAISYEDRSLQMPPDGKLPAAVVQDFTRWIAEGAVDPRTAVAIQSAQPSGLGVEQAQEHWAYRPLTDVSLRNPRRPAAQTGIIDALINQRLAAAGL